MINHDFYDHYWVTLNNNTDMTYAIIIANCERINFEELSITTDQLAQRIEDYARLNWGLCNDQPQFIKIVESLHLVDIIMVLTKIGFIDTKKIKIDLNEIMPINFFDCEVKDRHALKQIAPILIANNKSYSFTA